MGRFAGCCLWVEKMSLDEKMQVGIESGVMYSDFFWKKDVKQFIKELKELVNNSHYTHSITWVLNKIDKLAGEGLI